MLALVGAEGAVRSHQVAKSKAPESAAPAAEPARRNLPRPKPPQTQHSRNAGPRQTAVKRRRSTVDELRRTKSSPLVRKSRRSTASISREFPAAGISGRVTKHDILSFIETGAALRPQDLLVKGAPRRCRRSAPAANACRFTPPPVTASMEDRVEKMSVMRKKIAEHMTFSKQTSAHVTSVYEIDMTNVAKFREQNQAEFQATYGTKLTFMPFIFQAVTTAIREIRDRQFAGRRRQDRLQRRYQSRNGGRSRLGPDRSGDQKRRHAVACPDSPSTANDLADRARTKKLNPDEVTGGTFTITNPGVFGGLFGTPIINQPQVAILCVGTIEKRPKVLTSPDGDDYIAIRQMAYFALTYDHRIVDGADAERFLSYMKELSREPAQFSY